MSRVLTALILAAFAIRAAFGAPNVQPEVKTLLAETVKAYRSLRSVQMQTTFNGNPGGFTKPQRSQLTMRRPNLLLYELWQGIPGVTASSVMRYQCDGKALYIYNEAERYYTREKAPRDLKGLRLSNAGVEFAAMTGSDPFANIEKQVRSARIEGVADVEGELTDVVLLDTGNEDRTGEARFYIARSDRLIRRFTFESIPLKAPVKPPPRGKLNPDDPDEEQELRQLPVRFGYDTKITPNAKVPNSLFAWEAPADALLYQPLEQMLSPNRDDQRPAYVIVGKDGKRHKPLTFGDLVKMAKQQQKRKR
jgi:outer membrane lipoprotein-sorting protein